MQKLFKKFFTNNVVFTVSMIVVVVYLCLVAFFMEQTSDRILCFINALTTIFLYLSYRKNDKEVVKGLLGAQLMILTLRAVTLVDYTDGTVDAIFTWVTALLYVLLTANHFLINSSRNDNPKRVFTNQILCVIVGVVCIAWQLFSTTTGDASLFVFILGALEAFFEIYMVVYVETKLDNYQLKR